MDLAPTSRATGTARPRTRRIGDMRVSSPEGRPALWGKPEHRLPYHRKPGLCKKAAHPAAGALPALGLGHRYPRHSVVPQNAIHVRPLPLEDALELFLEGDILGAHGEGDI